MHCINSRFKCSNIHEINNWNRLRNHYPDKYTIPDLAVNNEQIKKKNVIQHMWSKQISHINVRCLVVRRKRLLIRAQIINMWSVRPKNYANPVFQKQIILCHNEMELHYDTKEHYQVNTVQISIHKRGRPRHLDFATSIPILQDSNSINCRLNCISLTQADSKSKVS